MPDFCRIEERKINVQTLNVNRSGIATQRLAADFTLKVARPLVRYDDLEAWPKQLSGASCFILRFENGLIGVTADHVVTAFEEQKRHDTQHRFLLRTQPIDLLGRIISRDTELDIATFAVTNEELTGGDGVGLECYGADWPPPKPAVGDPISICGFPHAFAKKSMQDDIEFRSFLALTVVEDINDRDIIVVYDPARDSRVVNGPKRPKMGLNLSGCSGGPALLHCERGGAHCCFPVGMMIEGPKGLGTGQAAEFEIIRLRRVHFIRPDGTIQHMEHSL